MNAVPPTLQFLLLTFSGWVNRKQQKAIDYLIEENRVLRAQLAGRRLRLTDDQRRRLGAKGKILGRAALRKVAGIVNLDTILRWYRTLIAKRYDGSKGRGSGRPGTMEDIAELVVKTARENPRWGYTRIRGLIRSIGHHLGGNTIKRILKVHGIDTNLVRYAGAFASRSRDRHLAPPPPKDTTTLWSVPVAGPQWSCSA